MGEAKRRATRPASVPGNIGDGPIDEQYIANMRQVARMIDHVFNSGKTGNARTTGFCLMVFPFELGPGRCNYMSNAERADIVTLLKEQLKRFEGQPDLKGTA